MANKSVDVKYRDDGIFLIFHRTSEDDYVTLQAIKDLLSEDDLKTVDFNMIFEAIQRKELDFEVRIADNVQTVDITELMKIVISKDKCKAFIYFESPYFERKDINFKTEIEGFVKINGIVYGLEEELTDRILRSKKYNHEYLIANGLNPINGEDGKIEIYYDRDKSIGEPKELSDGSVDYLNLDIIQEVKKGAVLAKAIEPTDGRNGKNVYGEIIEAKKGRPAPRVPRGKNVEVIPEEKICVATENGEIEVRSNRINVNPVITVDEVSYETGNINFDGSIRILNNVKSNMKINVTGNVAVYGIVEDCEIIAGGDIILGKGCMGRSKAVIKCGGNLRAKFIDGCTMDVQGNIESNSIMHSNITCNDSVILAGKNAVLVGGKSYVKNKIDAKVIGSYLATETILELGNSPTVMKKRKDLILKKVDIEKKIEQLQKVISNLNKYDVEDISDDKKKYIMRATSTKIVLDVELKKVKSDIEEIEADLLIENGRIRARSVLYAGCKVSIGNAYLKIKDDLTNIVLENKEGAIIKYMM